MEGGFRQTVDADLLARACAGHMDAHGELFQRFGTAVFTLARRLVKRPDVAEEIVQETFLDLMRRIGSYRGEAPFGFWLRKIAINRCLMFLRSYWEQQADVLDEEPVDCGDGFDAALQRADLLTLLERLSPQGRAVLWLHDVEGYTHHEIGELFGQSASFSKSQLARSHARLREMVTEKQVSEVERCTRHSVT